MDTSYDQVDEAQQHKFLRDCAYLIFVGNAKTINCVFLYTCYSFMGIKCV